MAEAKTGGDGVMGASFKFSLSDNSSAVLHAMKSQVRQGLEQCGVIAQGHATYLCPVDTGRLRASIDYVTDDTSMTVGAATEYAEKVELGGVRQRAQPYIKPAIADHVSEYERAIKEALEN